MYTFPTTFVPHLRNPKYHKNRVCSLKNPITSNDFSPPSQNQVSNS